MTSSIREYLDYRAFLREAYRKRHTARRSFNYNYIIEKLGLKSPGHITSIFNGDRNLPERLIEPVAKLFKLNRRDTEYFKSLVKYNQSAKHKDKDTYFSKLVAFHRKEKKLIDPRIYRYFSHWYTPVIRELTALIPVTDANAKECARHIRPKISPTEFRQTLELLVDLKLIRKNEDSSYERIDSVISTGDSWRSLTIHKYQRAAMDLAKDALDTISKQERDISTLTISISGHQFPIISEKLKKVRKEILEMASADDTADKIFQCNIQLFPVSYTLGEEKNDTK
ncbi:MAG: TIGR02147 family protein [Chitinivibrionales bacterium]|nr:TIGR02147 family protein [Chitinivibrionales bacterium]